MKAIVPCCVTILICSCGQVIDGSGSGSADRTLRRMHELNASLNEYHKAGYEFSRDLDFLFRGPLTVVQVEEELAVRDKVLVGMAPPMVRETGAPIDTGMPALRDAIVNEYRVGDKLYYFMTDLNSPINNLELIIGYVLVRKNKVVRVFVLLIN